MIGMIVALLAIVTGICGGGWYYFYSLSNTNTQTTTSQSETTLTGTENLTGTVLIEQAASGEIISNSGNTSSGTAMLDAMLDANLLELKKYENDTSDCKMLSDTGSQNACFLFVYEEQKAKNMLRTEVCAILTGSEQEACNMALSYTGTIQPKLVQSGTTLPTTLSGATTTGATLSGTNTPKLSDIEIFTTALKTSDRNLCTTIGLVNIKNRCHDTLILDEVRKTKDKKFCEELTDNTMKETCLNNASIGK
jgi:hypothetical protein